MRVLILGGTGLVGGYLLARCISAGIEVTVVSRSADKVRKPARVIVADISRPGWALDAGIDPAAFDLVVHLAYATSGDASYDRAVTVDSVIETVRHFAGSPLKHFIYLGSMSVFGLDLPAGRLDENAPRVPDNDYARNKIDASAAVLAADVTFPVSILHPTGVHDITSKRLKSYREMLANGYIVLDAGGRGINNIVHADDVAAAIVACFTRQQGGHAEEYVINGEAIPFGEWLAILERQVGVANRPRLPIKFIQLYRWPLRRVLRAIGLRLPILLPAYKRAIFERGALFVSDKATAHFGWHPTYRFADVIALEQGKGN
jgi:nucleoside-diphosphate-sugar epimerase